ncbi:MAG: hypothetical protein Q9216_006186 [Gyalolechia sp. 2 TL-2023]
MSVKRKLAVCGIFLLGALTVGSGIAKVQIYYNILATQSDPSALDITCTYREIPSHHWCSPSLTSRVPDIQTPLVYWPMVESSVGIIGACLPLLRPLFAGAASHGFMRDLHSVDIPTSERSDKPWNKSSNAGSTDEWNSSASTVRWGSDSMPSSDNLSGKGLPRLPASSLNMLRDTPSEGPWMKRPVVHIDMV